MLRFCTFFAFFSNCLFVDATHLTQNNISDYVPGFSLIPNIMQYSTKHESSKQRDSYKYQSTFALEFALELRLALYLRFELDRVDRY